MDRRLHLVPVATGLSDFEAKLLAAQLGSDGILWQTRGIVDSIYPFGGIDVLVPTDQLDDALVALAVIGDRELIEVTGGGGAPIDVAPTGPVALARGVRPSRWVGAAAVLAVVTVVMVRVLAVL